MLHVRLPGLVPVGATDDSTIASWETSLASMRVCGALRFLCVFVIAISTSFAQDRPPAAVLPRAFLGQAYYYQVDPPTHGAGPWRFRTVRGSRPSGIALDPTGILAGAATEPGEYHFTLEATDSSPKPVVKTRDYILTVPPPLMVEWTKPPQAVPQQTPPNGILSGEIEVTNGSGRTMDLTVIVVAVNTFNKAFALGYQRFTFSVGSQRIPFSSNLPLDTYVVHADAVGEIPETLQIYRSRLQTGPLHVP
jgi:hypothetical protein